MPPKRWGTGKLFLWLLATLVFVVHTPEPAPTRTSILRTVLAWQSFLMELPIDATAKCEVHAVFKLKNIKPIEIHRQLTEVYGESCMDDKMSASGVGYWQQR